jgi:hypothetical protein
MAVRTAASLVKAILGDDYGPDSSGNLPDLTPRIVTANIMVNLLVDAAAAKGLSIADSGTDSQAEVIERYLAAHYYTKSDPTYSSRSTGGASGSFIRDSQEPEPYKNVALDLDHTGCLNALLKRQRASLEWLGKPRSDQVPYSQRD